MNSDWKFIRQDVSGAEATTFDDSRWSPVRLPHTWNNMDGQDGGNDYYRGVGWYRRHLKVDQQPVGKSFFLKFDAASTVADVFVNGAHVGSHRGAFAAFCFDVTPLLRVGEDNVIAVKVNNAPDGDITPLSGDFTVFGGLYRGVHLLVLDKLSVTPLDDASSGVYITQTNVSAASAELEIRIKLRNAYDSAKIPVVRCIIRDRDGKTVRMATAKQKLNAHGAADVPQRVTIRHPHLWDGRADPYLYNVTIEVSDGRRVTDTVTESLGVRYFSVDPDKGFFLNGRPYALHGVNRHQERLDEGWAISPADQDEDFRLITEMGSTGVRLAHYQHAPYFYDLCDRGGIVVWAELCLVNEIDKSEGFRDVTRQQLTELIKQNYNHPSIMFWSLFNELRFKDKNEAVTESWCQLISDLNRLAKTLDPTRLTTAAWCCAPVTHKATSIPDVIALNEYHGWYGGKPEDWPGRLDEIRRSLPARCVAFSEYGAGASIQQHEINPRMPKANLSSWHPEEWQCVVHEQAWKAFKERPWLWGTFIWNMFDFAADHRNEGDRPGQNDKGMVTHDRKVRKDAFYWYKANWTDTPFVHITSQRYTNRTEATTPVKVYSNCESVELRVNGESKGSLRSDDHIFLWTGVTLREGDNRIEAIGGSVGTDCRDSCAWTFTPPVARINGPKVFGVRPGSPFLFTISATGERPMEFSAVGLPNGLKLDAVTGQITGVLQDNGEHLVTLRAKNLHGVVERKFRIIVGDRIALTPPMGWNSWNCWAGAVDQDKVLRAARAMRASGLSQHGWQYINIDDTWQGKRGSEFNALQPNEKFPDMKALCGEIHRLGLKAGIYSTPWVTSYGGHCGGSAENLEGAWDGPPKGKVDYSGRVLPLAVGKYSFATNDARQWAAWGFDYLKYDWSPNSVPQTQEMAEALRASGRDIIFSLSNTAPFDRADDWARLANSWRTTGDIRDTWSSMAGIGFAQDKWASFSGPGHWNDPDMLVVGHVGWGPRLHPTKLNQDEQYTHISLWCLLSAPLLLGCDLEKMDDFTLSLLTNDEVLDIDQDPLGKQATRVAGQGDVEVYLKPLENGSRAVGLFNRGSTAATGTAQWSELGFIDKQRVRDLWRRKELGMFDEKFETEIPPHGVILIKVSPAS